MRRLSPIFLLVLSLLVAGGAQAKTHAKHRCGRHHHRHWRGCVRRHRHRHRHHRPRPRATDANGQPLIFDGTFNGSLSHYAGTYGNCFSNVDELQERFNVTGSCNPGGDGLYRSDINTPNVYPAGVPECTSIPIEFPNGVAGVPDDTWLSFAETEDPNNPNQNDAPGWEMGLSSFYRGNRSSDRNQYEISFAAYNNRAPAWTSQRLVDTGWHTISICTNEANDDSGAVYGIWLDGVRQKFNHGPQRGSWELHGFPIIQDDPGNTSKWPLIVNDYTGGSPANQLVHGSPLITMMGSTPQPPKPVGGWNSP